MMAYRHFQKLQIPNVSYGVFIIGQHVTNINIRQPFFRTYVNCPRMRVIVTSAYEKKRERERERDDVFLSSFFQEEEETSVQLL